MLVREYLAHRGGMEGGGEGGAKGEMGGFVYIERKYLVLYIGIGWATHKG